MVARPGMTLVELLVVLAVIGLLIGVSVPGLARYSQQARLKAATRQFIGLLSFARQQAISSRQEHAVVVDREAQDVRVVNVDSGDTLEAFHLPTGISVEIQVGGQPAQETQLVFRSTGALNGRTTSVVLSNQEKRHTITVTAITGAVSTE